MPPLDMAVWLILTFIMLPAVFVWAVIGADPDAIMLWQRVGCAILLPAVNAASLYALAVSRRRAVQPKEGSE